MPDSQPWEEESQMKKNVVEKIKTLQDSYSACVSSKTDVRLVTEGTQSEFFDSDKDLKEANYQFGIFVARELSNISRIKRLQVMREIVSIFEDKSI